MIGLTRRTAMTGARTRTAGPMTVRLIPARDPQKIPELTLWTLTKDTRTAEARMRMTPIGPELRFYVLSRETGALDLLWSMIYKDGEGGSLGDDAERKRREFEVRGWTEALTLLDEADS